MSTGIIWWEDYGPFLSVFIFMLYIFKKQKHFDETNIILYINQLEFK